LNDETKVERNCSPLKHSVRQLPSQQEHSVAYGVSINVNFSSVSKTVRRVSLGSLILFVGALGSCYVGERQWERDVQEIERQETASGFRIFDGPSPETNNWQIAGGLGFFVAFSVGTAAYMLWRQER
jgi:hypothetical protein